MREETKAVGGILAIVVWAFILLTILGTIGAVWGLFFNRKALPYAEETRRLTYGQSLTYQQGSQRNFEDLCLQYAQAQDAGAKAILRDTIQRRKMDYTGPTMGDDVLACFSRLGI